MLRSDGHWVDHDGITEGVAAMVTGRWPMTGSDSHSQEESRAGQAWRVRAMVLIALFIASARSWRRYLLAEVGSGRRPQRCHQPRFQPGFQPRFQPGFQPRFQPGSAQVPDCLVHGTRSSRERESVR